MSSNTRTDGDEQIAAERPARPVTNANHGAWRAEAGRSETLDGGTR